MGDTLYGDAKKLLSLIGTVIACSILAVIGFCMKCVEVGHHDGMVVGLDTENYRVVIVREKETKTDQQLLAACQGHFNEAKPLPSWSKEHQYYQVSQLNNLPMYVQKYTGKNEAPHYGIIYAVFKQPGAMDKLKQWAKQNQYQNWDFSVSLMKGIGRTSKFVDLVEVKKPGSTLDIMAYFESRGRLYLWHGETITDLSEGLTGQVEGHEQEFRDQVRCFEGLGR